MPNDNPSGLAFLKQQLAGLDHRFAMETIAHPGIVQSVRDGDDGHALVMGHETANDRDILIVRKPRASEIEGLVEAIAAASSHRIEAGIVLSSAVDRKSTRLNSSH